MGVQVWSSRRKPSSSGPNFSCLVLGTVRGVHLSTSKVSFLCCSSQYALRPWLYILVHWPVTKAFSIMSEASTTGLYAFYGTRVALSLASLILEARLIKCAAYLQRAASWPEHASALCRHICFQCIYLV